VLQEDLIAGNDDARSTPRERAGRPSSLDLAMLENAGAHRRKRRCRPENNKGGHWLSFSEDGCTERQKPTAL
jgi:hypothetical protein